VNSRLEVECELEQYDHDRDFGGLHLFPEIERPAGARGRYAASLAGVV
jgi:hypothetical protein